MKQKEVEAQMIENHLRRLANEEQRLKKQIKIAQRHSQLVDQINERKKEDAMVKDWHRMVV